MEFLGQQAFCLSFNDQDKAVVFISTFREEDDASQGYEIMKYVLVENQFQNKGIFISLLANKVCKAKDLESILNL